MWSSNFAIVEFSNKEKEEVEEGEKIVATATTAATGNSASSGSGSSGEEDWSHVSQYYNSESRQSVCVPFSQLLEHIGCINLFVLPVRV